MQESGVAFSRPGGEICGQAAARPVDLEHLSRQTMGDRELEREVLDLFVQQVANVRARIADADEKERIMLAHGLTGSARGIGAFAVADCAAGIEKNPQDKAAIRRLAVLIDGVRDFIAAINR